jgi:hypothetical protein
MERRNESRFSILDARVGTGFSVGAMFTARGFTYPTIKMLASAGIDAPERLLFATETDLLSIPGIDESAFDEIARYRARFGDHTAQWSFQQRSARQPSSAVVAHINK